MKYITSSILIALLALTQTACSDRQVTDNTAQQTAASDKTPSKDTKEAIEDNTPVLTRLKNAGNDSPSYVVKHDWTYHLVIDEMRDKELFIATKESKNNVSLKSPYTGGNLKLYLRRDAEGESNLDAIVTINSGQFNCVLSCKVTVRFDNNEIQTYSMNSPSDYSSDSLFISNFDTKRFIENVRKSKKMIIELPFFNNGNHQFKFDIDQLEW